jgi:hypothetical protein
MKPTKFVSLIAFLYLFVLTCAGQAPEKVTVQTDVSSGIFKLTYKAAAPGTVKVSIINSKDETIFTETLTKMAAFVRPYNFNDQGMGNFKILVEDKDGKTEKIVSFSVKKVESAFDVSKIANAQNKYLLSIENKDADQIQVRIVDAEKNVLHEESITVNGKFSVVYNLNKVKASPTFEVAGSNGVWKTFTF